jgi:hypothetical protein
MVAILIIISISLGVSNTSLGSIESPYADLFLVPFNNQSREAELIILGHVLDKKTHMGRIRGNTVRQLHSVCRKNAKRNIQ